MYILNLGPLSVTFNITIRVKDNGEPYNLPPSFGCFDIYKVADYQNYPKYWDKDGYFIGIHDKEAMWLNFQTIEPVALLVGIDGINALNANNFKNELKEDSYLSIPPQLWLDGWKNEDGTVRQFVCTKTNSVGSQLGSKEQGMILSVYEPQTPMPCYQGMKPHLKWGESETGYLVNSYGCCGMGAGGTIKQKVYKDPYGLDKWKKEPAKTVKVYFADAEEFSKTTGEVLILPSDLKDYKGNWFGVEDNLEDTKGSSIFEKIKGVFS